MPSEWRGRLRALSTTWSPRRQAAPGLRVRFRHASVPQPHSCPSRWRRVRSGSGGGSRAHEFSAVHETPREFERLGMLAASHADRGPGRREPQGPGSRGARASLGVPQRRGEGWRRHGRRDRPRGGRARRAARLRALVGALRDPAAHARARRGARAELPARPDRARAALARDGGRGGRGLSRRPRRGRRAALARRRPLRRLPLGPDALAGDRAGQARDRGCTRRAAEAARASSSATTRR